MAEQGKASEQIEQRLRDALAAVDSATQQALQVRAELDAALLEEEAEKQAVFYGISPDEARSRIEQNRQERVEGGERTIWPAPNVRGGA